MSHVLARNSKQHRVNIRSVFSNWVTYEIISESGFLMPTRTPNDYTNWVSAKPGFSRLVFGSSTIDLSIIFALQLLIASHKQLKGVLGGRAPQF